jgi:glycosyltransferase involved in cell wall biosynthesis
VTKEKKKIFYIITKGNWGGAQRYVYDLSTSLPKDEFDVLVIHGQGDILGNKLQNEGVKTLKMPEMRRDINIFSEIVIFFKLLKIFFDEKPDIVHLNSSKSGGLGALAARLTFTRKIIFTVHGWPFNEDVSLLSKLIRRCLSYLTVLLATKTIVISKENYKQAPFKTVLIHNGIKDIDFKDRDSARDFLGELTKAPKDKTWIATISELHKNKGLEYLIQAISKLKEKPIVFIIGEGEEKENLSKLIEKLKLEKNVLLMGFVKNASMYLKAFDVFTLTSIKEGHPYVLLEAGLTGLPVIGSNISGIRDIIDSESGVLIERQKISEAIEKLLNNPQKRAQLGVNLKDKVEKEFSFKKFFEKTLEVYNM